MLVGSLTVATLIIGSGSWATDVEARPSTKSFTCPGVQDFIQQHGAVVMSTKSSRIYKRFVANKSYCSFSEVTETRTVPTKSGGCYLRICWEPLSKGDRFRFGN